MGDTTGGARRRFQALFLVQFVATSGFAVYRTVYLGDLGLTGSEVGVIGALLVLTGVVAQPLWGTFTDRYGRERLVLAVGAAVAAVGLLAYPLAGRTGAAFAVVAVGTVVFAAFRAPIIPLANAMVLAAGLKYGSVRALGSVAFGVGSVAFGFLVTSLGVPIVIYGYVAGLVVLTAVSLTLPSNRVAAATENDDADADRDERDADGNGDANADGDGASTSPLALGRNGAFLAVLAVAFLAGTVLRGAVSFFAVYVRTAGVGGFGMAPDTLAGVAWALKTLFEAVAFVYGERVGISERRLLWVGAALVAVAPAAFWLSASAAVVLLVQAVAGVSFAAVYLSAVLLADRTTDPSQRATAQTVLAAAGFGAGGAVGQVVAGGLIDAVGVRAMFGAFAGVALLAAAVGYLTRFADVPASVDGSIETVGE